jgi:dipeptidyl-peptidase-4
LAAVTSAAALLNQSKLKSSHRSNMSAAAAAVTHQQKRAKDDSNNDSNVKRSKGGENTTHEAVIDTTFLQLYSSTNRFRLGQPSRLHLIPESNIIYFTRALNSNSFVHNLYQHDLTTNKESVYLTAEQLLSGKTEELTAEEKALRERMRISSRGIVTFALSKDNIYILVPISGQLYLVDRSKNNAISHITDPSTAANYALFSPNSKYVSYVFKGNLYAYSIDSKQTIQLTNSANETTTNAIAEFCAQEEMARFRGYWWNPDSTAILYQQTQEDQVDELFIVDPAKPDKKPDGMRYPRPGTNNAVVKLGIININSIQNNSIETKLTDNSTGNVVYNSDNSPKDHTLWLKLPSHEEFPYLVNAIWSSIHTPLTILLQNRAQTVLNLYTANTLTGQLKLIYSEKNSAWINIDQSVPVWLGAENFVWSSDNTSTGASALRLISNGGDILAEQVVPGYRKLLHFDEKTENCYCLASPSAEDTTQQHIFLLNLKNKSIKQLTSERGVHNAYFTAGAGHFLHEFSSLESATRYYVRELNEAMRITAEIRSVVSEPGLLPRITIDKIAIPAELDYCSDRTRQKQINSALANAFQGQVSLNYSLVLPLDFNSAYKYPVILYVYSGPHHISVQCDRNLYLLHQWLANHGFAVISLDNRGTPFRTSAFERCVKHDLISIALNDQIQGLKKLGSLYDFLDLERVGLYGWSFGGYMTAHATMQYSHIFHAGFSGAPVCNWEDYDTHYTERYMGTPRENPQGYKHSAVVSHVGKLNSALFVVHGTSDDNVFFSHSLTMSNALFRAGKPHIFLPLIDFTHMVSDPIINSNLYSQMLQFFIQHVKNKAA